jgi:hypothetical protein
VAPRRRLVKEIRVHNSRLISASIGFRAAGRGMLRKVGRTEYCANQDAAELEAPALAI